MNRPTEDTERVVRDVMGYLSESQQVRLSSVRHVRTKTVHEFEGDLHGEKVAIRVTDCGPDYRLPEYRYVYVAEMEGGRFATGNGGRTPTDAMMTTHWDKLLRLS